MTQLRWSTRLGLIGLVGSQCVWLTSCDHAQIQSVISRIQQTPELVEATEELLAIHVDSGDVRRYSLASIDEESQVLASKQGLISSLYPEGKNEILVSFLETVELDLLEFLAEKGIEITTEVALETTHQNPLTQGGSAYLPEKKQIIFKELSGEAFEELLTQQFYHEVGHVVDTQLGDLSTTEGVKLLFEEGSSLIFTELDLIQEDDQAQVSEYFAESFNLFFKNPAQLANHEDTYKYICSVIEQIYDI